MNRISRKDEEINDQVFSARECISTRPFLGLIIPTHHFGNGNPEAGFYIIAVPKNHSKVSWLLLTLQSTITLTITVMAHKGHAQPTVDSTSVFHSNLFNGKVLFCTGGGSGICRGMTEAMVRFFKFLCLRVADNFLIDASRS
jgi:hypothetical protein